MQGTVDRYFAVLQNGKTNTSLPGGARINPQLTMYAASGLVGSGPEGGEAPLFWLAGGSGGPPVVVAGAPGLVRAVQRA